MAETNEGATPQRWTSTQAYIMAVVCLLVGCAVGYLLRGSTGGNAANSAPAPAAATAPQPQGMPPGGGQPQQPTPEQMKAMAEQQAAPMLAQLKSKPNDPKLLAQLGNLYYDAQQFPASIDYYQKSLAVEPKNAVVRTDMATAMYYNNDADHAIAEFSQALKDDPKNSNALYNRGMVRWQAKMDIKGAMADWELLLKQDPNYAQADRVRTLIEQVKKHMNVKPGQTTDKPTM